jgi:aspartate aminotransferase
MPMTADVKTSPLTERINRIEPSATLAVVAEADKLRQSGVDVVDLGAGEPHFSTPQHIKDAAVAAIEENFTKYTPVAGTAALRDAMVRRHAADFNSDYKREECIATTGGKQALFNTIQILVDHGDEVIIPVPYWVSFKDMVRFSGGVPVFVECDEASGFALTAEMIERAITPRTKAIIINSPSNPSGAVMKPEAIADIVRLAHRRGIYLIADECYLYLDYTASRSYSAGAVTDAKEHIVIAGSLSKTYAMTGWRMGYALAPAPLISALQKLQSQSTSNPTSIVQKAAIAALSGSQECLDAMRAEYIERRNQVTGGLNGLPGVRCREPQGAFYAYPNISALLGRGIKSNTEFAQRLLRETHVAVVPGEAFGTREHIRISYATTVQELDKGMARMGKFIENL